MSGDVLSIERLGDIHPPARASCLRAKNIEGRFNIASRLPDEPKLALMRIDVRLDEVFRPSHKLKKFRRDFGFDQPFRANGDQDFVPTIDAETIRL